MIRLFRSEPNNLIVVIHQYFILFNFSGQIMSNYSFRFASFGFRSASFRFASFYHSNHLFFDLFQFFSGCRHYMFNSATNWIQKTHNLPKLSWGLTYFKSLLTWPWEQCCIAGDSLLYGVWICRIDLWSWFIEMWCRVF